MSAKRFPTIRDVARSAGVSVATVSRILNDKPDVSEQTRQKVLRTIDDMGYAKRTQWQQLTSGKSRVVSLHYPRNVAVHNQVSHGFIIGASVACEERGYSLQLITQSLTEQSLLDRFQTNQSDGVILMEIRMEDWRVELLHQHQLPFVMIGHCERNEGVSFVDLDFETAVVVAFDHLVALGHRHISYLPIVTDPGRERYGPTIRARAGYERACQKHDLDCQHFEVVPGTSNAKDMTLQLLGAFPQTTAIVSLADITLVGIFAAIHTLGLSTPGDISVVGLTNDEGAQIITPHPTAIRLPSWMMGYEAGKMLVEQLESGEAEVVQSLIAPQLVVRDTTGPVAQKHEG
jgi:DNA-binding LacI/PurR family transcriptional regulator